jgi:UDP-2,3-diacylglucosamine pyrophosphatase LpxH
MELLKNNRLFLILAAAIIFESCSKESGYFSLSEPVDRRVEQSLDFNKRKSINEITVSTDDYTIFCMSDSHVGTTVNLDKFFKIAEASSATAVIMAGDLCSGREGDYKVLDEHLPADGSLPLFMVAGNHDLHYAGWNQYFSRFGSSTYTFTVGTPSGSDLYICLDTSEGTLGEVQLIWLENILSNTRQNYRRCMLVTHNNFFRVKQAESTNPLIEEITSLVGLFTKYHVDMLIAGHDHRKDDRLFGVTRYIVMDPLEDEAKNAGYFVLRVVDGMLDYKFVTLNS